MSKVISVLEKMASDAAMNGKSAIADLVATSDITASQQGAIIAKDSEKLAEKTHELPQIRAFVPLIAADEDEEQAYTVENKTAVNF